MEKIICKTENAFMKIKTSGAITDAVCGLRDRTNEHAHLSASKAIVLYYRNRYGNELVTSAADLVLSGVPVVRIE